MMRLLAVIAVAGVLCVPGCAFVPKVNPRIEEAKAAHASAAAEPGVATLAPGEWARAREAFDAAIAAWSTLQDPAVVDHLAYVAKQRAAIAREVARMAAAEAAIAQLAPRDRSHGNSPGA